MKGFQTALVGVPELVRAIELTNARTRERTKDAIRRGTEAVARKAEARAPRKTGELASTIRGEIGKDGMVGYVKAGYGKLLRRSRATTPEGLAKAKQRRADMQLKFANATSSKRALSALNLGVYAPVVERGDPKRNKPRRPFMTPALMEERPAIIQDISRAPMLGAKDGGMA